MAENPIYCKYCNKRIAFLQSKNHNIKIDWDKLSIDEKQSFLMHIPIPYIEPFHREKLHFFSCSHPVPTCKLCNTQIIFVLTKPNPAKYGHNNPGVQILTWSKVSAEDKEKYITGIDVHYSAIDHKDIVHWIDCPHAKEFKKSKNKFYRKG